MTVSSTESECVALRGDESVCVGENFVVLYANQDLLPGEPRLGRILKVVGVEGRGSGEGELKVSYVGSEEAEALRMSAADLAKALCLAPYRQEWAETSLQRMA